MNLLGLAQNPWSRATQTFFLQIVELIRKLSQQWEHLMNKRKVS